jgi:hypothetical protein
MLAGLDALTALAGSPPATPQPNAEEGLPPASARPAVMAKAPKPSSKADKEKCRGFERTYEGKPHEQIIRWINDVMKSSQPSTSASISEAGQDSSDAWLRAKHVEEGEDWIEQLRSGKKLGVPK